MKTQKEEAAQPLLSTVLDQIQRSLFPRLEAEWGPLTERMCRLTTVLSLSRIDQVLGPSPRGWPGRPEADRRVLARAFVAKAFLGIPTTRALIEQLHTQPSLRRVCGWIDGHAIPSEATFSRVFAAFAASELPQRAHRAMIEIFRAPRIVGHVSRDSTSIRAREKAHPRDAAAPRKTKPTRIERQLSGMSLQEMLDDLPRVCNFAKKRNSDGKMEHWKGYKLHVDWADGAIPISCILTSASTHDSQVAIPLATMTAQRVTSLYDLMDSSYDAQGIKTHSAALGHVPIIDHNPRSATKPKREFDLLEARRYANRTTAERGNGRLKDDFGGRSARVRGAAKVMAHLMFGMLALTAEQLLLNAVP